MNLADVMDDLGAAVETIDGLRQFPYWASKITPPCAVVAWPDPLTFDSTYARGADRMEVPVIVVVGKIDARSTRDAMAAYMEGSGDSSVKAAIESFEATAYDSSRVDRVEVGPITVAATEYLAATFYIDLIGQGA